MKSQSNPKIYQCDTVTIDTESGKLSSPNEDIRLGPVNMQVLSALLEKPGQVVSRNELFDQVWPNQEVSDDTLTRCISDLRKQFASLLRDQAVIETLPKRGYRWLLAVDEFTASSAAKNADEQPKASPIHNKPKNKSATSGKTIKLGIIQWIAFGILGLFIISTSSLWLVEHFLTSKHFKVALLPIEPRFERHKMLAFDLEQHLMKKLIEIEQVKVLSQSVIKNRPQNPFRYLSREFGTDWLIEGSIQQSRQSFRLTLNLVDARSATVSHSLSREFSESEVNLKDFSDEFLNGAQNLLTH